MSIYGKLQEKPFLLDDGQLQWVKDTFEKMELRDKVGQIFCLCARYETDWMDHVFRICEPGGIMYRRMPLKGAFQISEAMTLNHKIPMLLAADLERGGNCIVSDIGTQIGSPMAIAATQDADNAYKMGEICAREASSIRANWAFAPVIDIDYNFRNPITNVRTFGNDPETVKRFGTKFVEGVQAHGMAATVKHFPGDGRDERDHHIVTSINDMDCEEWMDSYGAAYRSAIGAGVYTVMVGHIMQPAWSRRLRPGIKDEEIMPATLAPELMQDLLRDKLGFNGLIVTDATTMVGFNAAMPRKKAVPYTIAAGADMFLFSKDLEEDYRFMMDGIKDGIVSMERIDEAVLRVLGLKAALRLYEKTAPVLEEAENIIGCKEHHAFAKKCMDQAVTLVKEEKGVMPVSPEKYPRIMVYPIEKAKDTTGFFPFHGSNACDQFVQMLKKQGFQVSVFEAKMGMEGMYQPTTAVTKACDLIIYVANLPTQSNQTQVRIDWAMPIGCNCPVYMHEIPTIFISLENPYHLLDAPRVKTYINAYCSTTEAIEAVLDKLMGRSEFKGVSPVDPFCGRWDTHLM